MKVDNKILQETCFAYFLLTNSWNFIAKPRIYTHVVTNIFTIKPETILLLCHIYWKKVVKALKNFIKIAFNFSTLKFFYNRKPFYFILLQWKRHQKRSVLTNPIFSGKSTSVPIIETVNPPIYSCSQVRTIPKTF